jgi:hypothetical protein
MRKLLNHIHRCCIPRYDHPKSHLVCISETEAKRILTAIGHIEEAILITIRSVEFSHKRARSRKRVITEYKESTFRREGYTLPDYKDELPHCEIGGYKEYALAEAVRTCPKTVVAMLVGRHAPAGKRMGHAGALAGAARETAAAKLAALAAAGARTAQTPEAAIAILREIGA